YPERTRPPLMADPILDTAKTPFAIARRSSLAECSRDLTREHSAPRPGWPFPRRICPAGDFPRRHAAMPSERVMPDAPAARTPLVIPPPPSVLTAETLFIAEITHRMSAQNFRDHGHAGWAPAGRSDSASRNGTRGPGKRGIIRFVDGGHHPRLCDLILPGFVRSYTFLASLGALRKGRWSAPMDGQADGNRGGERAAAGDAGGGGGG